ncbi:MAG TPA: glutamine--tRNA ligase/YqeY domain fusion protein [Clostridia bacterium]|nr:glutamine--tRNA ligase/YqeY domain fusion protein [Clostridia bacterium]HOL61663.1 glutamine--tRNA ligase/YqeY domain fusion protein [Clostridia bacterium]HPO54308.1 glutamine--tRNA ligase/YqeY domain fusion protein [Clostridia bacterium]
MEAANFIEDIINEELESGKVSGVYTRFPPEPNGYLHIGHCKSLCINFGIKEKYQGRCNLRFDDTNPTKEDVEYVESIKEDIRWLGFKWDLELYASDYFGQMYDYAVLLIKKGLAYVCELSAEEIRITRGTLTEPGKESPYRNRSVEENLRLFEEMKAGKYPDGSKVLRAKIDMSSPNMNMRDPVIYRILRAHHHRTGDKWCIYPMYDFAHPISDAIEGITHSICTLEFEDHRPLYDWVVINCGFEKRPRQIEFARLNIKNTIMSKRYLKKLVDTGFVAGWNDPRMPTISGMRERGYPPEALKEFCARVGVAKANSEVDPSLLEYCVRETLNRTADRAMVVENPLLMIIDNIGEGETFEFSVDNNPNCENSGTHTVVLRKEIYIDKADFELNPPPKYHRLVEGGMVRLRGAFIVRHVSTELDESGNPIAVHCEYIPDSASGGANSGIKVKGVIQWVNKADAVDCELYKYGPLLFDATETVTDFNDRLNPNSLEIVKGAKAEPFVLKGELNNVYQFMRMAYYKKAAAEGKAVRFYLVVSLKDSFNK